MKCLVCGKAMKKAYEGVSNNPETGEQYNRVIYTCKADDTWITSEIPKKAEK